MAKKTLRGRKQETGLGLLGNRIMRFDTRRRNGSSEGQGEARSEEIWAKPKEGGTRPWAVTHDGTRGKAPGSDTRASRIPPGPGEVFHGIPHINQTVVALFPGRVDEFCWFARDEPLREPRQHSGWDAILDRKRNVGFAEGNPCTSPQWGRSTFNVFFQPGLAVWVGLDTRMCGGWLLEPARAFHCRKVLLGGPFAAGRPYPPFSLPQRVLALVRLTIADSDRRRSRPRYVIVPFVGNAGHCTELISEENRAPISMPTASLT